jgi:hypothetical protein
LEVEGIFLKHSHDADNNVIAFNLFIPAFVDTRIVQIGKHLMTDTEQPVVLLEKKLGHAHSGHTVLPEP